MELGSDFELNISSLKKSSETIFDYLKGFSAVYTDSGRSAAKLLCSRIKQGKLLLPSYICESVIAIYEEKFEIEFYQINSDFEIDTEDLEKKLNESVSAVYLMHYFGKLQGNQTLHFLESKRTEFGFIIIEDTTHSIFTNPNTIGDYCVCSLRKWFAIPDGGVIYSKVALEDMTKDLLPSSRFPLKLQAMLLKYAYIHQNIQCNARYRKIFQDEENKLDKQTLSYAISDISKLLLLYYSVQDLKLRRQNNMNYLSSRIDGKYLTPILKDCDCVPLSFPVLVDKRDDFRTYLNHNHIYCAIHWPIEHEHLRANSLIHEMSQNIISLPIDQRYGLYSMDYLVNTIENYFN